MGVIKEQLFKPIKGMNLDLGKQALNPDSAFKLLNIKNQIVDSNSSEVLINERGNSKVDITSSSSTVSTMPGTIVGVVQCTPEVTVVFTKNGSTNFIYRLTLTSTGIVSKTLAQGSFNFGDEISGIFCYENSEIQKVYWVDGVNQLRYINIADSNTKIPIANSIYLDSSPEFKASHSIEVKRVPGGGIFTSGVIQYAFTYYMKNGAETGIVDMTPLYYISEVDRGIAADETVGCSFEVSINNIDTRFDYLRLYSIQRTSINGTPIVKIVKDLKIK